MTRWARGGSANKKKPEEATDWGQMHGSGEPSHDHSSRNNTTDITDGSNDGNNKRTNVYRNENRNRKEFQNKRNWNRIRKGQDDEKKRELSAAWRNEKRSEQRRVKRFNKRENEKVCFNCRQPGHKLSDCPQIKADSEQGTGICFKCGSTEHSAHQCKVKIPAGEYPFAKCFICGETGHLSKQCPDNPRGMYPKGGCCKICSSVEHFMKDCPELQKQQGIGDMTVPKLDSSTSLDADQEPVSKPAAVRSKKKTVKF